MLHEFGHYIHLNYINGAAAEVWNEPWAGVADLADPRNRDQRDNADRKKKLDDLEVVTDYGKTNEREGGSGAAMKIMKVSAKYRMQRTLSLSGLYGKAVMRLAEGEKTMGNPVDDFKDAIVLGCLLRSPGEKVRPVLYREAKGRPT